MSNRPGIGAHVADEIASELLLYDIDENEVPRALVHGKKMLPLGRYLRGKVKERLGFQKESSDEEKQALAETMRPLRAYAFENSLSFKEVVRQVYEPETLQSELRHAFNNKGKTL